MSGICNILGVPFNNMSPVETVELLNVYLSGETKAAVCTPNPEMVMLALKDPEFMEVLNKSAVNIPDGIGIIYASRFTENRIEERVPGCDTVLALFDKMKTGKKTAYFFGGAPGVAEKAKEEMEKRFKGLNVVGTADGYFDEEKEKLIIADVNEKKPDLLLVGIGFPKQEKWIAKHIDELNIKVAIGVGGSLDVFSGTVKRAPKIFIKLNLEWFYRLLCQPSRIGRMMQLPAFMVAVIKDRYFKPKDGSKPKQTVKIKNYKIKIKKKRHIELPPLDPPENEKS
ncbi:MAG: WecB/TagA/CpsF family glycosyltransferase [Firmicutes bacterium]|nr:WecB/TagA/CpsF family glycosyltransferase [Bacillota bacterium]